MLCALPSLMLDQCILGSMYQILCSTDFKILYGKKIVQINQSIQNQSENGVPKKKQFNEMWTILGRLS